MRHVVLILPELVGDEGTESVLRQKLPALQMLAEIGELSKVSPMPRAETPEAMFLGMRPIEAQLRQGPLTVSALGADPPDRSIHFHLSVLSFEDGKLTDPTLALPAEEEAAVKEHAKRLNTKALTFVAGEQKDHALVWEGLADLATTDPTGFSAEPMKPVLPEGEIEAMLRKYIDDSINMLSELEFNQRRVDEGLPMLNALWPWGHGVRTKVPNLALRRGGPAVVESNSMRLAGLSRLAGYRHGSRTAVGVGVHTQLRKLADRLISGTTSIAVLDVAAQFRAKGMWEELEWFVAEMDKELLTPLLEATLREPSFLSLIAPGSKTGLALSLGETRSANSMPFDERALEERTIPVRDLATLVESGL